MFGYYETVCICAWYTRENYPQSFCKLFYRINHLLGILRGNFSAFWPCEGMPMAKPCGPQQTPGAAD